jgi:hypothetical protein
MFGEPSQPRWCELRIGELLGEAEHGGDRSKSPASDMNREQRTDRYKFRLLAQHREIVEKPSHQLSQELRSKLPRTKNTRTET